MAKMLTNDNILEILNNFNNVDEVRQWINSNIGTTLHIYDEWPRGYGFLSVLTRPMKDCKFSAELQRDVQLLEDGWSTGTIPAL